MAQEKSNGSEDGEAVQIKEIFHGEIRQGLGTGQIWEINKINLTDVPKFTNLAIQRS